MKEAEASVLSRFAGASRYANRIAIAAYRGTSDVFDRATTQFASVYADQNEHDYQALRAAAASGRITAQSGL